ncbi:hypothetical protein D7Z54_32415 [Salibacterium salarium]|uniref:Uncharacterized protein n=1 Tax=Salibacterium salarium TaxID=284579 RepID=A0A3R9PXK9_9BACI|nr:hypothetical protein [Salibacterium salarium]RSL29217.1 hypothetical protein D7Z54_32415 [Salibacterium salarium]
MLNFTNFLYRNIGKRIKHYREKQLEVTQDQFVAKLKMTNYISLTKYNLSRIENANNIKKNNPYLLTDTQIQGLSNFMDCSPNELIFGTVDEKVKMVKLILLAIIINGSKNKKTGGFIYPFIDSRVTKKAREKIAKKEGEKTAIDRLEEFLRLSKDIITDGELTNQILYLYLNFHYVEEVDEEVIQECIDWYTTYYPFFIDPNEFDNFQLLINDFDKDIETQSNLIIKLLMGNIDFSKKFMEGIRNIYFNQQTVPGLIKDEDFKDVNDIKQNTGQYGGLAILYKEAGYVSFLNAFNEMWNRNNNLFMSYFNDHLFSIDFTTVKFKSMDDDYIHGIINSYEFIKLLYSKLEEEMYNKQTMLGHDNFRLYLQQIILEDNIDLLELHNDIFYQYNLEAIQLHNRYF